MPRQAGCCCCRMCFEQYSVFVADASCVCNNFLTNLAENIDSLNLCKVLFCIPTGCRQEIALTNKQFTKIKNWVEKGGRLWCCGEYALEEITEDYRSCYDIDARTKFNNLMSAIGSSLRINPKVCNCGCEDPDGNPWLGINGTAKIVTTPTILPGVYHACTSEITGGTVINRTKPIKDEKGGSSDACLTSYPWLAIEKIGKGVVVAAGDLNVIPNPEDFSCGYDNCELFYRFINSPVDDLV